MWPYMEYYINWVSKLCECGCIGPHGSADEAMDNGIEGGEDRRRLWRSWEPCLRVEEMCIYQSMMMNMSKIYRWREQGRN